MSEFEAYNLAVQYILFSHELGEAVQVRIEFWSIVSYVLLVLAYIAPEKLSIPIGSFLIILYVLFSLNMIHVIGNDMQTAGAAHTDAMQLLGQYGLNSETILSKAQASTDDQFRLFRGVTSLYFPGLFLGTIAYVGFSCYRQWKSAKSESVE
jgi:hypothetical protein